MYWYRLLLATAIGLLVGGVALVLFAGDFRTDGGGPGVVIVAPTLSLGAAVLSSMAAGWLLCPRNRMLHSTLAGFASFMGGTAALLLLAIVGLLLS